MSDIIKPAVKLKFAEGVTRVAIHQHRYLKGYTHPKEQGVFVIDHGHEPTLVAASPDFPLTIELPDGYKVDGGMKPLAANEEAEPVVLKKHYNEAGSVAQHPHVAPKPVDKAADKSKRPSDKSPV
jgi:hypothetical protein